MKLEELRAQLRLTPLGGDPEGEADCIPGTSIPKPTVPLPCTIGDASSIIGPVKRALAKVCDNDFPARAFEGEARAGNYSGLKEAAERYVNAVWIGKGIADGFACQYCVREATKAADTPRKRIMICDNENCHKRLREEVANQD